MTLNHQSRTRAVLAGAVLVSLLLTVGSPARAEPGLTARPAALAAGPLSGRKLSVRVGLFPPMVMRDSSGGLRGFDIDLAKAVAEEIGAAGVEFQVTDLRGILDDLEHGRADLGLAGITITDEREQRVDFSHHYFDSGLRIMARSNRSSGTWSMLVTAWNGGLGRWLGYFMIFLLVAAHLMWWAERGQDAIKDDYRRGLPEALWFTNVTSTTVGYGDIAPKKLAGRLIASVVMWIGIGISGILIGHITSIMTVERMAERTVTLADLHAKPVATVAHTTSVGTLRQIGAQVVEVRDLDQAGRLLKAGQVEAVVYDDPALRYYAQTQPDGKVSVAGSVFDRQYYGIAMPTDSSLEEAVNRALTKFRSNGVLDGLNRRWFRGMAGK